jgi:hypothetical protein
MERTRDIGEPCGAPMDMSMLKIRLHYHISDIAGPPVRPTTGHTDMLPVPTLLLWGLRVLGLNFF